MKGGLHGYRIHLPGVKLKQTFEIPSIPGMVHIEDARASRAELIDTNTFLGQMRRTIVCKATYMEMVWKENEDLEEGNGK